MLNERRGRGRIARIGRALAVCACLWVVAAVALVGYGIRMPSAPCDVAVIFGNALDDSGAPKPVLAARLDVGVQCYRTGQCPAFLVSGAIDGPGLNEATAMRDYLVARGVNAAIFRIEGRGSHEPVADNGTDAGRAQNRRVEIYVGERAPQG